MARATNTKAQAGFLNKEKDSFKKGKGGVKVDQKKGPAVKGKGVLPTNPTKKGGIFRAAKKNA